MLTGDDFQNYSTVLEKPVESNYQGTSTLREDKISDIMQRHSNLLNID